MFRKVMTDGRVILAVHRTDPKERGGLTTEDKSGCEQERIEYYGQEDSVSDKFKFDTGHGQITRHPSGPTVLSLPFDAKSGAAGH